VSAVAIGAEAIVERHEVVALAAELARRELRPRASELDLQRPDALEAAWRPLAEVGFDRALLTPEEGGVGLGAASLLAAVEELATGEAGVALMVLLANAALVALPRERVAALGAGERWALVPVPAPELCTPARITVSAGADGRPRIRGTLAPALGAFEAEGIVIVRDGVQPLVVAAASDSPALEVSSCGTQLGLCAAAAARIRLDGVAAQVAAGPEDAHRAAVASLDLLRAGAAAIARGIARRAHELALGYARERVQGGLAIVEYDAVREMLAAMSLRAGAGAGRAPAGRDGAAILTEKVGATEAALASCLDAVQVFGGTGYMRETGVEKLLRDAKYLQLWPEPNWAASGAIVEASLREP
jgi:alkylation response protein AidB-like acyl-CoA dehydrogenase